MAPQDPFNKRWRVRNLFRLPVTWTNDSTPVYIFQEVMASPRAPVLEDATRAALENKEINILVIGCYHVGKSTLINTLFFNGEEKAREQSNRTYGFWPNFILSGSRRVARNGGPQPREGQRLVLHTTDDLQLRFRIGKCSYIVWVAAA